jgi:mono/diheme cytochrome c family protein
MHRMGVVRITSFVVVVLALAACAETEAPPAHLAIPGADPDRGKALIAAYGCGACHFVEGIPGANGIVAPRLENFASRVLIAGRFPNVPRFIVPWLISPPALKPETAMPDLGIADAKARDIASYLYTLGSADVPPQPRAAVTNVTGEAFEALRSEQRDRLSGAEILGIERAMNALATDRER